MSPPVPAMNVQVTSRPTPGIVVGAWMKRGSWGHGTSPWRLVWAVLPLLFMAWVVIVTALRVRQMDEYQVKLFFPGLAVGFTVSIFAAITLGTLSAAGFTVPNAGWPVALIGIVAWEVTNLLVRAPKA